MREAYRSQSTSRAESVNNWVGWYESASTNFQICQWLVDRRAEAHSRLRRARFREVASNGLKPLSSRRSMEMIRRHWFSDSPSTWFSWRWLRDKFIGSNVYTFCKNPKQCGTKIGRPEIREGSRAHRSWVLLGRGRAGENLKIRILIVTLLRNSRWRKVASWANKMWKCVRWPPLY